MTTTECPGCGKKGHTIDSCFRIHKCQICGKHGHLSNTCYQNPDYKPHQMPGHNSVNTSGPSPECQICSKKGHTTANCFYRSDVPANHPSLSIPTCQICGLKGHVALNCTHRANYAYQGSEPPASLTALSAHSSGSFNGTSSSRPQSNYYINDTTNSSFSGGFHPSNGASSSSSAPIVHSYAILP